MVGAGASLACPFICGCDWNRGITVDSVFGVCGQDWDRGVHVVPLSLLCHYCTLSRVCYVIIVLLRLLFRRCGLLLDLVLLTLAAGGCHYVPLLSLQD